MGDKSVVGIHNLEHNSSADAKRVILTESDIFGNVVIGQRENQVEINFFEDTAALSYNSLATETVSGGASITDSLGQININSGSSATSSATLISVSTIKYRAMHEIYNAFTAAWDTNTSNSTQFIGMFNTTDGFAIGYNGTSFSILHRENSSDTFITSFSEDLLDGSENSKFTLNGIPVALDQTKTNIFRIRYGWLGSAPVMFEVLTPDNGWTIFHIIKRPNSSNTPVVTTPNLPLRAQVTKTSADSTSLVMRTACWAGGSTSETEPLDSTITDDSLAKKVRAVLAAQKPNGDYTNIDATAGGNLKVSIEEFDDAANPVRSDLEGVGDLTVGTSEVEIIVTGTPTFSIRIRADTSNTGIIFIGKTGVLSDGTNDFIRLEAGDEVIMPYDDVNNALFSISDTSAQTINIGALL